MVREVDREAGQSRVGGRTCREVRDKGTSTGVGRLSCLERCGLNVAHLGRTHLSSYSPYFLPKPFHTSLMQKIIASCCGM